MLPFFGNIGNVTSTINYKLLQRMVDLDFHLTNNIICSKCRDPPADGILPIKT